MSFFNIHFFIFKLTSVWTPEFDCIWKSVLYSLYSRIVLLSCALLMILHLFFLLIEDWDINILSTNIFTIVLVVIMISEIINLKRQKKKIIKLTEVLKITPYLPEDIKEQNIISQYEKKNRKQICAYVISLTCGLTCFFIGKISAATVPILPYRIWVPYSLSNPYYYWTTVIFIASSGIICGLIAVQFISFFASATLVIESQVSILRYRFTKTMKIIEKTSKDSYNHDGVIDELKILEKKLIVDFVGNHLEVLKLAEMINDIFSIDILIFYSTTTILICTNAYVSSTVPLLSHEFFATGFLCVAVICSIIRTCFSSNEISIAFDKLHEDLLSSTWTILSKKTKKSLMIVMIKTQKPYDFTIGKIIKPSRESLKNIAQVVYSLYNLMRKSNQ